jgi:hypothetical protein
MAISDDQGKTWYASRLLAGFGNIQPAVLRRRDGTLVAYMRENGSLRTYFVKGGKSMKHAAFNESWIRHHDVKE